MITLKKSEVVSRGVLTAATNATAVTRIDTWGTSSGRPYEHATILIKHNPAAATNANAKWTSARVLEGSTTAVSSATAVTGLTGTTNSTATSSQFVLPAHNNTSNPSVIRMEVPLALRQRYLFIETQPSANYNTLAYDVILSRGKESSETATELQCNTLVEL